eukprot:9106749-Pyramimonas_sp.AAC.1
MSKGGAGYPRHPCAMCDGRHGPHSPWTRCPLGRPPRASSCRGERGREAPGASSSRSAAEPVD